MFRSAEATIEAALVPWQSSSPINLRFLEMSSPAQARPAKAFHDLPPTRTPAVGRRTSPQQAKATVFYVGGHRPMRDLAESRVSTALLFVLQFRQADYSGAPRRRRASATAASFGIADGVRLIENFSRSALRPSTGPPTGHDRGMRPGRHRSTTTSPTGREQQMSRFPVAGRSSGSGW